MELPITQWFHFWYISEGTQNTNSKEYMHRYVHCSVIYKSQAMEATHVSLNKWVEKEVVVHIYNEILLSHKKWNLTICHSMDGPRGYYAKWNKSVRERQILYDFTYICNLKNKINEQNWNRLIDAETRLMIARGEGVWGTEWKREGIEKYKLVVTK